MWLVVLTSKAKIIKLKPANTTGSKYNCINGISLAFNSLHCLTTNINLSRIIRIVQPRRNKKELLTCIKKVALQICCLVSYANHF